MDLYTAIHERRDIERFAEACPPRETIERLIEVYVSERTGAETFIETVNRIGVDPFKEAYIAA